MHRTARFSTLAIDLELVFRYLDFVLDGGELLCTRLVHRGNRYLIDRAMIYVLLGEL